MPHSTITKQNTHRGFPKEFTELQEQVSVLRSLLISWVGMDDEGTYRPEFVKKILRDAQAKPTKIFTDAASFLAELRKV